MLRLLPILFSLSFLISSVFGQIETIPDPAGSPDTVVVNVTIDPDSGEPTTSVISTILPAAATPTPTTNPANVPVAEQGPVGAPPDTATLTGPPQIVFTFTTNDGAGNVVVTTTFTPTYQTPNPTAPLTSGTIWNFSQYTALFGSATAGSNSQHGDAISLKQARPSVWRWTAACGILAFGAAGVLLI